MPEIKHNLLLPRTGATSASIKEREALVIATAKNNHNLLKQQNDKNYLKPKRRNRSPTKKNNLSALHSAEAIRNKSAFKKENRVNSSSSPLKKQHTHEKELGFNTTAPPTAAADDNLVCSTPKENESHIEYITADYFDHLKANFLFREAKEIQMESRALNESQSFIDKFFKNESVTEQDNKKDSDNVADFVENESDNTLVPNEPQPVIAELPTNNAVEEVETKEAEANEINAAGDLTNNEEHVTSFLDYLFEKKNLPGGKTSAPQPIRVLEANKKEENKPLFDESTNSNNKFIMNSNKKVEIDDMLKYLRDWTPKEDNSNLTVMIQDYLRLHKTFTDKRVAFYSNTRGECQCIRNALGCCLQNFYIQIHTFVPIAEHRLVKACCQSCDRFNCGEFLQINAPMSTLPDWYKYFNLLDIKKRFDFVNDALEASQLLRDPSVQQFLNNTSECTCYRLTCCLTTLYDHAKNTDNESQIMNFKQLTCCHGCSMKANQTPVKSNGSPSMSSKLKETTTNRLSSNSSDDEEPIAKVPINPFEGNLVKSIDDFFNVVHISRQFKARTLKSKQSTKKATELPPENKIPLFELRSTLKERHHQLSMGTNDRSHAVNGSGKKEKCVRFYDPRKGFYPVPIKEWQENLREPVFSIDTTLNNPEWHKETSKNDYTFSKSQRGN